MWIPKFIFIRIELFYCHLHRRWAKYFQPLNLEHHSFYQTVNVLLGQSLDYYFKAIKDALKDLKLSKLPEILCEPGRAIVAESGSTIVRINLRKKQKLYINDGTYGSLFDAGTPNIVYPSRLITNGRIISKKMTAFDFYGPT